MAQIVDSKQQKLGLQEIVKIAAQNTESEYTPEQVMGALLKELTMPNSIVVQIGNTAFVAHRTEKDPTVAMMRGLNADTPQNYMENSEEFAKVAYNSYKIDTIVSDFTDPSLINIFAYVGRNKPKDMGYQVQKSKDGKMYRVTAKLGPDLGNK